MQKKQFSVKNDTGYMYQTIWIEDQAPRLVGPDLDPYCLKGSLKINIFLESVRKYFHFVQELFEGTVLVVIIPFIQSFIRILISTIVKFEYNFTCMIHYTNPLFVFLLEPYMWDIVEPRSLV